MTIEFDPIDYAQQLESAGVARNQADVHAKALNEVASEGVSTSDRLQMKNDLQCDIHQSEERLTARIDLAKTKLGAELQTFRAESSAKIDLLDAKIDGFRTDLSTKIGLLNAKIDGVRTDLSAKIGLLDAKGEGIRIDLTAKIDGVRNDLNAKIDGLRADLNAKIDGLRADLNAKIDGLRADLNAKIEIMAADLRSVKDALAMHRWVLGLLIVMNGAILARVYFP
ncbi:hypothetical protein RBA41_20905 [Massilia sp. CCM 9210]|uniref:hypothetical protein n=1 Tax=Massilia scottii TaxID=3057166 RepID=UPI0027964BC1|nr:hypothetical protein [Massilia sp. CCM 9210]MDQ1815758.1 hypothetical protein [Massilia sp. CCM 9210]